MFSVCSRDSRCPREVSTLTPAPCVISQSSGEGPETKLRGLSMIKILQPSIVGWISAFSPKTLDEDIEPKGRKLNSRHRTVKCSTKEQKSVPHDESGGAMAFQACTNVSRVWTDQKTCQPVLCLEALDLWWKDRRPKHFCPDSYKHSDRG